MLNGRGSFPKKAIVADASQSQNISLFTEAEEISNSISTKKIDKIKNYVSKIVKEKGIKYSPENLKMVEYISDRIAVMYRGQIVEIGDPNEIIENPIHPYTRSLINSIPSINNGEMIISTLYDPKKHNYNKTNQPSWFKVESKKEEHLVFASKKELMDEFGDHNE